MFAHQVVVLVTGAAFHRIHTLPIGSAPDLHGMRMVVIFLARRVPGGVTIHAARMAQYGNYVLESSSSCTLAHEHLRHCLGFGMFGLRSSIECQQKSDDEMTRAQFYILPAARPASSSAALTRSGVNGKSRRRPPVASKIALPIAAGVTVIAVSPAPVAGTSAGVTKMLSILGIS